MIDYRMSKFIYTCLAAALICSCAPETRSMVDEGFRFAESQLRYAIEQTDSVLAEKADMKPARVSPRTMDNGNLVVVPGRDWTSGFFPGELWYMYGHTGDEFWRNEAERFTERLESQQYNRGTHDLGFMMFCSFGNGYRLTGNMKYRDILLTSAKSLASRFNPTVGCIRSWDHNRDKWRYPVIIDNMMNLELLYWATKETGDSTYCKIADIHAHTTMKNHFRDDFSSYHVVDYDDITGEVRARQTHQGYSDESAWARGQAWGLYGYTVCYRMTGKEEYLRQAERIAGYMFSAAVPEDLIFYWDFDAPGIPDVPRDASAAAITASALYELSLYTKEKSGDYRAKADRIVDNLFDGYRPEVGHDGGFLLLHSTGAWNFEIDVPLVYADYYFLEALTRRRDIGQGKPLFTL